MEREKVMLLFTAKTRGLIDRAVNQLSNVPQQRIWSDWARDHVAVRLPDGPVDDGAPPPPREVILVALAALELMEAEKRHRLRAADDLSEDEVSDLEGDLTYIEGVSQLLNEMPAR
jgi:hypothetical protein